MTARGSLWGTEHCVEVIGAYQTRLTKLSPTFPGVLDLVMIAEVVLRVRIHNEVFNGVCALRPGAKAKAILSGVIDNVYNITGWVRDQESDYTEPLMLFGSASLWVLQYSIFDPFSKLVVLVETRQVVVDLVQLPIPYQALTPAVAVL